MPDAWDRERRLRVLTLIDRLGTSGGGERLAMQVAMRLDRSRFESWYCASRWNPDARQDEAAQTAAAELRAAGVNAFGLGRRSPAALWLWRPLVRTLRREAPYWANTLPQLPRLLHRALAEDRLGALRLAVERLATENARRNDLLAALFVVVLVALILLGIRLF